MDTHDDPIEVVQVVGQRPVNNNWDRHQMFLDLHASLHGVNRANLEIDWGRSGRDEEVSHGKAAREHARCSRPILELTKQCKNIYTFYTGGAGAMCVRMPTGFGKAFCGNTTGGLISAAREWCEEQGKKKIKQECGAEPREYGRGGR